MNEIQAEVILNEIAQTETTKYSTFTIMNKNQQSKQVVIM